MIIFISSARTIDFRVQKQISKFSIPEFINMSAILVDELRHFTPRELMQLMDINHKLAELTYERFLLWQTPFTKHNAKQALLAFKGEVYRGILAENYSETELLYAQDHLRILSGLYGILRPLDLIQPYRLEMGTVLENEKGKNLYPFWRDLITKSVADILQQFNYKYVINLASNECFSVIATKKLKTKIITPTFLETRHGDDYKVIVVYTKKARGLMTSFILKNKITNPEEIKYFDSEGYSFNAKLSTELKWVFSR